MNENDDDYFTELRPEFDAYNRVGLQGTLFNEFVDANGKLDRGLLSPLQIFQIYIDSIARKLKSEDTDISNENIEEMIEKSTKLKYIKHKNPSGYVLGYIASNAGRDINKKSFNNAISKLTFIDDTSLLEPDVLRYARLWLNLNLL